MGRESLGGIGGLRGKTQFFASKCSIELESTQGTPSSIRGQSWHGLWHLSHTLRYTLYLSSDRWPHNRMSGQQDYFSSDDHRLLQTILLLISVETLPTSQMSYPLPSLQPYYWVIERQTMIWVGARGYFLTSWKPLDTFFDFKSISFSFIINFHKKI